MGILKGDFESGVCNGVCILSLAVSNPDNGTKVQLPTCPTG